MTRHHSRNSHSGHRRTATVALAVITAISVLGATPVQAAVRSFGKKYQLTATMKGAQNMTVLLVSAKGQTLASAKVTKSNQKITLKTAPTTTTKGATLQLVSGSGAKGKGAYYGPVVIGWKGTKVTSASKVTSKLKSSSSTKISLGTVQVKGATAQQGYAVALAASKLADTTTAALAKASKGKPSGVGNYGKNQSVSSADFTVSIASVRAACAPVGTPTCDLQGNPLPGNQNQNPVVAAPVSEDDLLGGDKDDDGIPNAFDVNDDGDAVVDANDSSTPSPKVGVETENSGCSTMDFRIFTNFKAVDGNYSGTINAYGTGNNEATRARSAELIGSTMTMVFQPIKNVCGSAVTASYLKGNGVAYAPGEYVRLGDVCNTGDYQWSVGSGKICDPKVYGGGTAASFGSGYTFSGTDLPSGQDTFTMKVETADGNSYEFTSSPGFVFVTHPMLISYDTGSGTTAVKYGLPVAENIPVASTTEMTLTMYRPQRLAFDGEDGFAEGAYYDLAGFTYTPEFPNGIRSGADLGSPSGAGPGQCDALKVADSALTDDTKVNTATKPTFTVKWKLASCFTAKSMAWTAGYVTVDIKVEPKGPGGNSAQKMFIQTVP